MENVIVIVKKIGDYENVFENYEHIEYSKKKNILKDYKIIINLTDNKIISKDSYVINKIDDDDVISSSDIKKINKIIKKVSKGYDN